jgi:hypothetical protein
MIAVSTGDTVGGLVMVLTAIWFLTYLELDDRRKRAADRARQQVGRPADTPVRDTRAAGRELARRDRFERVVMPAVRNRPPIDHGGSPDLSVWPPSMVEREVARSWSAYGSDTAKRDLVRVCGSLDRARAVVARIDLGGDR